MAPSGSKSTKKSSSQKAGRQQPRAKIAKNNRSPAPVSLQQAVLDIFACSFETGDANELRNTIQKVKGHLYNRDFDGAFESELNQEAYCTRWSPSRALAYLDLFCSIEELSSHLKACVSSNDTASMTNIVCIGGGAGAEPVAFAAALNHASTEAASESDGECDNSGATRPDLSKINIQAVDIANWSLVISKLVTGIGQALGSTFEESTPQSTLASSDPVASASIPSSMPRCHFQHSDVLKMPSAELDTLIHGHQSATSPSAHPSTIPPLITILFTLNELYSTSMSGTTKLLLALTSQTRPGTLLLVVDSPGSYSTVKLAGAEKQYPMQWMLHHTLKEQWQKVGSEESRWWRMDREGLVYKVDGVELEDMRMQWHLYRRV